MTERLTDEQLAEIRARVEAATLGPWWQKSHLTPDPPTPDARELSRLLCYFDDEGDPRFWLWDTDGVFVAAARTDVPALLDEIDALRSERDDLQRALRQCAAHCAHLTGEDKEDFAELDRTTAVPLLEVGELVSDTIAGLEFEAAQKDATAITAAVAEERERCIDSLKSLLVDNSVSSGRAWNSAVKKCAKTIRDRGIRAIEEQPNGSVQ